jgi:hypothetical protein
MFHLRSMLTQTPPTFFQGIDSISSYDMRGALPLSSHTSRADKILGVHLRNAEMRYDRGDDEEK